MQRKNQYFKHNGKKVLWRWFEIKGNIYAMAFTIKKIEELKLFSIFHNELIENIKKGYAFPQFKRVMMPILKNKDCWGEKEILLPNGDKDSVMLFNEERLEIIYHTNLHPYFINRRAKYAKKTERTHPYWIYITEMDVYTRPTHAALHMKAFHCHDPLWEYLLPPNGFGCRCRIISVSKEDIKEWGATIAHSYGKPFHIEIKFKMENGYTIKQYTTALKFLDNRGRSFIAYPDLGFDRNKPQSFSYFVPELEKKLQQIIIDHEKEPGLMKRIKTWFTR